MALFQIFFVVVFGVFALSNCTQPAVSAPVHAVSAPAPSALPVALDTSYRSIHVFVALCDNENQGIVPVPPAIGNGQDPDNNLYWGCGFGVRTYFKKSKEWKLLRTERLQSDRLERLVFRHITKKYYLVADAYDGRYIRQCTVDFLKSSCGKWTDTLHIGDRVVGIGGNAALVAYVGHDGLMNFQLEEKFQNTDGRMRDAIILACSSKYFFGPHLDREHVRPLVWTTHLMCPEAYTLHDALSGYVAGETAEQVRARAARAYAEHQHCSERAARNLLVSGW